MNLIYCDLCMLKAESYPSATKIFKSVSEIFIMCNFPLIIRPAVCTHLDVLIFLENNAYIATREINLDTWQLKCRGFNDVIMDYKPQLRFCFHPSHHYKEALK